MQQTIIMKNLKEIYYKKGKIEGNTSPFFLSFLLYNSKEQFDRDKEARKDLLRNTLHGIADLRTLMNSQSHYSVTQYGSIEFEIYFEFCLELIEVIIEKKWKVNIVLKSVDVITYSHISRRIIGDTARPWLLRNAKIVGVKTPIVPKDFKLDIALKEHLAELDRRYNKFIVDDII